ncbi:hypothetical protein AMIS_4590 [Actinoplanes missouriensis 431]|uniref:Uncharacterized protein n=1 Tax=Actinoplanes missouriensis (strain ATCC 14538 / DSM 43046 / CBS 188.64 / JCM 3121 / NBRC 102363 / NCIMB 12654 / NRRL B-3342 / UNCC 431) TaxID=512565 RepID=I0GY42_ACTM4|nr:hypothetical protein AMIS_4590 [Actinoplanes missouriensis 431]
MVPGFRVTHAVGACHAVVGSVASGGMCHVVVGWSPVSRVGGIVSARPLQEGGTESGTWAFQGWPQDGGVSGAWLGAVGGCQEARVSSFQPVPGSTGGDAAGQAPGALTPSAAHGSRPLAGRSREACAPPGSAGGAGQAACAPPGSPDAGKDECGTEGSAGKDGCGTAPADGDQSSGTEFGSGTSAGHVARSACGARGCAPDGRPGAYGSC